MSRLSGKTHTDAGSPQPKLVKFFGRFETDGANNPPATSIKGRGIVSVVKEAGAGLYTITLDRSLAEILHISPQLWAATSGTQEVRLIQGTVDPGDFDTRATFQLETHSVAGTEANLDGPLVSFELVGHVLGT